MIIETILALVIGIPIVLIIIYFCCGSLVDPFEEDEDGFWKNKIRT